MWTELNGWNWQRADNAVARYMEQDNYNHAKLWLPGHRGWVAYAPTSEYPLTYRSKRGRYVNLKFKTAAAAMARLDKLFPYEAAPASPEN